MKAALHLRSLASILAACAPLPVAAQTVPANDASPPPAVADSAQDIGGDIVVTAQRRSESLQKVPLSVTVASGDLMRERNFTDPAQLPFLVPSLQFTNFLGAPGATNFSVRGIGTASFSHLVEPTVATVIDGVVMSRPEMGVAEFSDLARVEVLNGPQGMLFGKNASAGLVNIVTNRPRIGALEGQADLSYENIDAASHVGFYKASTTLNIPLTSIAAARVTGYYTDQGSLLGNTQRGGFANFGRRQFGIRGKLLIDPGAGLSVYVSADYTKSDGIGTGALTARSQGPALASLYSAAGIVPSPTNAFLANDAPTDLHYKVAGAQAEIAYAFDSGVTLTNIIGYRSYNSRHTLDLDGLQVDLLNVASARFTFEQFTDELRVASPSGRRLEYQAGLFYFQGFDRRTDRIRGQLNMAVPPPDGSTYWLGINAQDDLHPTSYAAYAQGTYHITDKFSLTAGGRLTRDELRFDGGYNQNDIFITIAGGPGAKSYRESQSKTNFSWRGSVQYAFTPNVNAYVTVARGYKGPGYNLSWAGTPGAQPVGPETSMDYEAGLKTRFGGLLFNVSAYWEEFSDFQVQSFQASGVPGVGSFIIQNAGSLRARGVEANASLRVTPQLTLSAAGAYNDAVYRRFQGAPCYVGQTAAQGCVGGVVDASGKPLANAPRWSGNASADLRQPVGGKLTLLAHGDIYARSEVNFSPNGNPFTRQGGYNIFNASLGIAGAGERWTLRAFCHNCFDKRFVSSIDSIVVGGPGDYAQSFAIDSFRSIGLALNFRY